MKLKSLITFTSALILTASGALSNLAQAQTSSNADAVYSGFLRGYLTQSGTSAYFKYKIGTSATDTAQDYMWRQGRDITANEDDWFRTHSSADATLVTDLLNTFTASNGLDWSKWDVWNDDLGWATISFVRGYAVTGNSSFLTTAETNFNAVWSRGWDASGGGGIWERIDSGHKTQRSMLATGTFIITGAALYQATGNSTYLSEAETAYAWVRANIFNPTSTTNAIGAPGQVNEGLTDTGVLQHSNNVYNEGLMIDSATRLYSLTGNSEYLNDAKLVASYTMNKWPIQTSGCDMFLRGLSNLAWQNGLWSTYQPYLSSNAAAAWKERRTDYNITNDVFNVPTTTSTDVEANQAISALTAQEVTAISWMPPTNVSLSGTWEIQNANSGLALNVKAASKSNGAAVQQYPFTSGQQNSLWTFVGMGGGYYRIQNVNSGLYLSVNNASGVIGASMVQSSASGSNNDRWLPVKNSDGTYSFYSLSSALALNVPGSSTSSGIQLDQWYANGVKAQNFNLIAQ